MLYSNQCTAVSYGLKQGGVYSWTVTAGLTKSKAEQDATKKCSKAAKNCQILLSECSPAGEFESAQQYKGGRMKTSMIKHAVVSAAVLSLMACGKDAQVAQAQSPNVLPMASDAKVVEKAAPVVLTPTMALVQMMINQPTDNWGKIKVAGVRWEAAAPSKAAAGNYALTGLLLQKAKNKASSVITLTGTASYIPLAAQLIQASSVITLTGTASAFDEVFFSTTSNDSEVSAAAVRDLLVVHELKQIGKNCQSDASNEMLSKPEFYEGEVAGQKFYVHAEVDNFTNAHVHEASLNVSIRAKPFDQEMALAQCKL
jgi:hypothetical protein